MPFPLNHSARRSRAGFAAALLPSLALLAGCVSTDLLRNARRAFDRAQHIEASAAFYEPILAKVRGETSAPPVPPQARQYYLAVIANMEMIGPTGRRDLQRQSLLGQAWALRLLAQWRVGRIDDARVSLRQYKEGGQEALDLQDRALVAAFSGVLRIEDSIAAVQSGQPFATVHDIILGDDGAWRILGRARMETARAGATPPELLETRLASFKLLKDAHDQVPPASPLPDNLRTAWVRARAEAQTELAEFASLASLDATTHLARARQWQELCGLDPLPR